MGSNIAAGHKEKSPLEEVENLLKPTTRTAQVTPVQQQCRRKHEPISQPTHHIYVLHRFHEAPISRPTQLDYMPFAMKGVVLTATGEILATPSPAELVNVAAAPSPRGFVDPRYVLPIVRHAFSLRVCPRLTWILLGLMSTATACLLPTRIVRRNHFQHPHLRPLVCNLFLSLTVCTNCLLTDSINIFVDFSRVHFLCTANNLDTISVPFPDCMEVLEVFGYIISHSAIIWDLNEDTRGADVEEQ